MVSSEAWFKARRLRRFIRACEAVLATQGGSLPPGDWRQTWLAWAREHADRLDPMTNGFLEREHQRLTDPDDEEDEPEPAERSVGSIMQEMMFGKAARSCRARNCAGVERRRWLKPFLSSAA